MEIAFSQGDWARVERDWSAFWAGELERPMAVLQSRAPDAPEERRWRRFFPQYGSLDAEGIMDVESERLSRLRWHGDAFPCRMIDFGPGSLSCLMGAALEVGEDTVWFKESAKSLEEIDPKLNPESRWGRRIDEILDAALRRWGPSVQVVPSDAGGGLDVLAALRGAEKLLLDFYDAPEELLRLSRAVTESWLESYEREASKILRACGRCANWAPMLSKRRTYMLQCDFSYMISPELFERYALPEVERLCDAVEDSFYHLDGKGQLPHLDAVLGIKKLKGVQWVPGAGQPEASEWLEVLAKIRRAGKLCQIYASPEGALRVKRELGGKGFVFVIGDCAGEEEAGRIAARLNERG